MADNANETGTVDNTQGQPEQTVETTAAKTYTQAEVDELLQKESDRRVTAALKKAEEKNAQKLRESEKLARMNEQEKFQYELEQREKAIIEKEKALALAENKNEASKILAEKGISLKLVDFVVDESADTMNEKIKLLDAEFKRSVKAEVEKRLGSNTPKMNLPPDTAMTKESFRKMSLREQQELASTNPQLYKELTQ